MTTPNAELAYAALDQIDAHPELWNQDFWFTVTECGTAGCLAGWACLLTGDTPTWSSLLDDQMIGMQAYIVITQDGVTMDAEPRARRLLGLTFDQSEPLFDANNTREDLGRLVAEIFGPRPGAAA